MEYLQPLQVIWDYLGMHQEPKKADCIVGFGNFNTNIARRAAELYHQGYAPRILFTGGLGRNTEGLLPEPEAVRFAKVAMACGVPECDIILEGKSTNTKENIDFTRNKLVELGLPHERILGVHQPFMERRITAAIGVYWPELDFTVTSPQVTIPQYLEDSLRQGITENGSIRKAGLSAAPVHSRRSMGRLPRTGGHGIRQAAGKIIYGGYFYAVFRH